jgi:hypothetical protein
MLLTGGQHPLFDESQSKEEFIKKVLCPEWSFPNGVFSALARDFFLKLTCQHPHDRYSAA